MDGGRQVSIRHNNVDGRLGKAHAQFPYVGLIELLLTTCANWTKTAMFCCVKLQFGETKSSIWSYMANRLRCAAKLGGPGISFGGYIVLRGPTGGVMHGSANILKKALLLVGAGAKVIDWCGIVGSLIAIESHLTTFSDYGFGC